MVFTVRLILVITLLLTTCASVPVAQRRTNRRSVPEEVDTERNTTASPISNDVAKTTILEIVEAKSNASHGVRGSLSKDATSESKPKTETSSQKYNDTNVPRKTKSRGNAKYFTTTTEKYVTLNVKITEKPENVDSTSQPNAETNSNVIETQLQNNTEQKTQNAKEIEKLPDNEEKPAGSELIVSTDKVPENLEKPHNFVQDETEESTENTQTTKRNENGRSLSMNIEKYISPEFHNQNNFYTSALFSDTKKFMPFKDFTSSLKSTGSFELNTELTTPRNQFFDSKFQAVRDDVSKSLDGIDKLFKYGQDGGTEAVKIVKEDLNSDKYNDTKADVDYKKFRHLETSESKTRNRIHKDYLDEKGVHLDLVSNYNDTKIIDDGISDGLNKIPATGVGAQYKEKGQQKLSDMENQESKKIVAENPYKIIRDVPMKPVPNKTDGDADAEVPALTNKIETEYTRSTQSILENIDPITADSDYEKNSKENAINVFKRGSTKKTDASPTMLSPIPETTSVKPIKKTPTVTPTISEKPSSNNKLDDNTSVLTPPPDFANREENSIISTIKKEQEKSGASSTGTNLLALEKEAKANAINVLEKEKIIEPSVVSEDYGKPEKTKTKVFVEPIVLSRTDLEGTKQRSMIMQKDITTQKSEITSTRANISLETTLEYSRSPKENLINVIKRGSTKIAEVDHAYFEDVAMTPVTMKSRKLPTVTEEQPNEILPIETVSPRRVLEASSSTEITTVQDVTTEISSTETTACTELTNEFSAATEVSSTETPSTILNSEMMQSDTTVVFDEDFTEDLLAVTELTEIFNVSYPTTITTESEESSSLPSTLPYSTEQSPVSDDNISYYSVSDEDSSTIMYEVTTNESASTSLDINFESKLDWNAQNKTLSHVDESQKENTVDLNKEHSSNLTENDIIKQNEIYAEKDGGKVISLNVSAASESANNGIGRDIHDIEDDLNPDDADDDYVESANRKVNQSISDLSDLEGEGEHVIVMKTSSVEGVSTTTLQYKVTTEIINITINNLLSGEEEGETTTIDILGLTGTVDEDNSGKIAAIVISSVGAVCLLLLGGLLIVMRKRQKRFNYGQRCRPVSLDAYSMDNVSICNTVGRRKGVLRTSKRSYGNPAFDDPATVSHPLNFSGLTKFAGNLEDMKAEFEEIPQVTTRTNELPEGCEVKNRYANVIPLPETRVFLNYIDGYPNSDYINANYVRGAKGARHYYIACQAPLQNTIDDFWRMVWEQQTKVILMLTSLFENGIEKCADYLPPSEVLDCHRLFGDFQVTLKKREVKDKYIISNLQLKNMVSNSWREITHLWYLEWPDKGVPEEANSIIAFLIEARSYMKSSSAPDNKVSKEDANDSSVFELSPVVVHCSPGTGRTGTVIGCDIAIREFELSRQVDIPKIVYKIRRDRASSVQTKEQYAFIYKVINLYATKLTGGALDSI